MKRYILYPLLSAILIGSAAVDALGAGQAGAASRPANNRLLPRNTIEINEGWKFRRIGDGNWYPATVPGCVHADLFSNGLIEDPFFGTNEKDLQWIENENWEYRVGFTLDEEPLSRENIEIGFLGLDTYAEVYLNGTFLLSADNMFREWRAECKSILRKGQNVIRILFQSPVDKVRERWESMEYELPGGPKVLTRKAGYHYGWDWGPRFVTSGIWRPVHMYLWDYARINDLHIIQRGLSDEWAWLSAVFTIEATAEQDVSVSMFDPENSDTLGSLDLPLIQGKNVVVVDFGIYRPELWWTNGLGKPHLYDLLGILKIDGKVVDWVSERIGIRTIEVVREGDEVGESFYFKLNGKPVFMKGSNYVPQDNFLNRVTPEHYENLIRSTAEANMNMLRVWGGGIYENDIFYDLCDEYGILVWQDFMFACAMYPGDDDFLENVKNEATENIIRLRNHPCIALWCGNNEIDEAWHNWGWQERYGYSRETEAEIWKNYSTLFHSLLPKLIKIHDNARFYWPSSPKYGRGDPRSLYEGDVHYWGVWHDAEPFHTYKEKTGRFMSEYGFQSFPSLLTVKSYSAPEQWDIESEVMLSHQKHPKGNELIRTYMERNYLMPKDFPSFLYVSQLLQAEGIKIGIEAHRREKPYCMGTLYWQLNDCWPVASWSSIDSYGRWKALHYYAKRANSDVLVSPTEDDGVLSVYIVSDRLEDIRCTLKLTLMDFAGAVQWERSTRVVVEANSSGQYFREDVTTLLGGNGKKNVVLVAELLNDEKRVSRNLHYFTIPKELELPEPEIKAEILPNDIGCAVVLSSDKLIKNCYLHTDGLDGFFEDNFFDLLPGETVLVEFYSNEQVFDIAQKIKVMSLVDTFSEPIF
jgi:beta-mannosidase